MSEQDGTKNTTKRRRSRQTQKQSITQPPALQCSTNDGKGAWVGDWKAQGQPWRTEPEIDEERQRYLAERRGITPNIEKGIYPFKDIKLSRADVEWLLATHENGRGSVDWSDEKDLHGRRGLDLRGTDLRKVDLSALPLARTCAGLNWITSLPEWLSTTPEQQEMARVHLEGANLSMAHLEGSNLIKAYLEDAYMIGTHLEKADLSGAYLAAYLIDAHLEDANLTWAHLERANLYGAHLERANLKGAFFDILTNLENINLGDREIGFVSLVDVRWGGVDLSGFPWWTINMLGDERKARQTGEHNGEKKTKETRLDQYRTAVRANHQLAAALRNQGMDEQAANFSYHAQVLQRSVDLQLAFYSKSSLWRRLLWFGGYFFSWFLSLLAGYGYKANRSLIAYLLVIGVFTTAYYILGQTSGPHFSLLGALVFSVTSFHGRGFFPGGIKLDDPITVLSALEAIVGLTVEVSLIAAFTQRFFNR